MTPPRLPRFGALDLLRGVTVAAMIVVNNPGNWNSVFPQLMHAAWHGVTAADLIFPAFIFIMGVAISFALPASSALPHGSRGRVYRRIASRSALLVLMGLVLNVAAAWPDPASARIPGVLQRIGVTYGIAAAVVLNTTERTQGWLVGALLLGHWAILAAPLGGAFTGSLEPGVNVAAALDRAMFGSHLLAPQGDPEGALGLLTSVATTLLGAIVGSWLRRDAARRLAGAPEPPISPLARMTLMGTAAIAVGYAWSFVLPLNKALWTASFAMLASGAATLSLVFCALLDRAGARRVTAPFLWLGTNPLAVYFLSELVADGLQRPLFSQAGHLVAIKEAIYWDTLVPLVRDNGGPWSSLLYACVYTLIWIGVAGVLWRKGIRVRV